MARYAQVSIFPQRTDYSVWRQSGFQLLILFSCQVVSNSLRSPGLQHTGLACPLSPRVCLNSRPLSQWCHLTIFSSIYPFSFCLQSFPALGSFQWVSSSHVVAKVLEFQLQHQSSSEYSGLISFRTDWFDLLAIQGTLKSLFLHQDSKASNEHIKHTCLHSVSSIMLPLKILLKFIFPAFIENNQCTDWG